MLTSLISGFYANPTLAKLKPQAERQISPDVVRAIEFSMWSVLRRNVSQINSILTTLIESWYHAD